MRPFPPSVAAVEGKVVIPRPSHTQTLTHSSVSSTLLVYLYQRDCFSINTLFSRMVSQAQGIVVSNSGASSSVAVSNSTAIFMVETIPLLAGFVAQSFSLTQSSLQDTLAREELKSTLVFSLGVRLAFPIFFLQSDVENLVIVFP